MATNFPANPSNGDTFAGYTYDSNLGAWKTTTSRIENYLEVANSTGFASSTDLDAYLQVANSTSFATTSQLDGYLQVANSTGFASSTDLDAYLQVANSTGFASSTDLDAYLQVANLSNITSSLIPSANVTYDLGSTTNYWKDLYLSGNTIFLGSSQITLNANGGIDLPAGSRMGGTLIGSGSGGGASVTIADTAPGSPSAGDLWWSANTSELFIYYTDTDTSQWVQATTPGATGPAGADGSSGITKSASDPTLTTNGSVGDLWLNTSNGEMYALTDATANNNVWTNIGDGTGSIQAGITASGGTVSTYSNNNISYKLHTFTSSGSFIVTVGGEVEYLVVAGGGGGGNDLGTGWASGGGAGGYRSSVSGENSGGGAQAESALTLAAGTYTVTVGAGGSPTSDGSDSVFSTVTSIGGGSGGDNGDNGGSGGSGGGGQTGGSGTSGQGYVGGSSGSTSGASGGGAGGAGFNGDGVTSNFATSSITNSAVNYANGGKGGTNNIASNAPDAAVNTGDGAEGGRTGYNGGNGGSGIVIIRYQV